MDVPTKNSIGRSRLAAGLGKAPFEPPEESGSILSSSPGGRVTVSGRAGSAPPIDNSGRIAIVETFGSGGAAFVSVMKPADLGDRHDTALGGRCDRARNRRILLEREMRARSFVVVAIQMHQPLQSPRAEHDDVIEALASRRSNEPLGVRVLPRGARGREDVGDAHRLRGVRPSVEGVITVPEDISWCLVPRERFT